MPRVEFHILKEAGEVARLRHACHLVEQAYTRGERTYIYVGDDHEAQRMDDSLWTFRDQAFIPHELLHAQTPSHALIMAVIGTAADAPTAFQGLLLNLSGTLPATAERFTTIFEVIDNEPQRKQQARERYKQYRDQGFQLETINH